MTLCRDHDKIYGHEQKLCEISKYPFGSEELYRFRTCVHSDLDLSDATFGLGHDTSLVHGQQFCEILFRSDERGKKLWPGHDLNRQKDRRTDRQTW